MIPGQACICLCFGGTLKQTSFSFSCTGVKLKGFWEKARTSKAELPWEVLYGDADCLRCRNPRLSHGGYRNQGCTSLVGRRVLTQFISDR